MSKLYLEDIASEWSLTGTGIEAYDSRTIQKSGTEFIADKTLIYNAVAYAFSTLGTSVAISSSGELSVAWKSWIPFKNGDTVTAATGWISNTVNAGWLQALFDKAVIINKVVLTSHDDGNFVRSPIDFTIRGSNDNFVADDNILHTVTGAPNWIQKETRTYTFTNNTRYTAYRIDITVVQQAGIEPGFGRASFLTLFPTDSPVAESPLYGAGTLAATPIVLDEEVTGAGSILAQYKTDGGAYNGSWVSIAAMNAALSGLVVTNLQFKLQFNGGTTDRVRVHVSPSYLDLVSSCDYPDEADVLEDVDYDFGNLTGTLKKYSVTTDANDTLRQRIVDVLTTRLATITVLNGYKTDVGNSIHRWDGFARSESQLPAIEYKDTDDFADQFTVGKVEHDLTIEFNLISTRKKAAEKELAEQEMREIIADLNQMVGTDIRWSDLAEDTQLIDDTMDMSQLENGQWAATVSMTIQYRTDRFNSYQ